jgi:hypothetical protein
MYSSTIGKSIFLPTAGDNYEEVLENAEPSPEEKLDKKVRILWTSIDGIGAKAAFYLMKYFTIDELLTGNLDIQSFNDIKNEGGQIRKIGMLIDFPNPNNIDNQIKLLSGISGFTKKKAIALLKHATCVEIADFAQGEKNHIEDLKIGKTRIVGKAARANWKEMFNYVRNPNPHD